MIENEEKQVTEVPAMPEPPEGCVYGPWVGFKGRPFAVVEYVGMFSKCPAFKTVGFYDGSWDGDSVIGASERELLRLAKENAELKARPSQRCGRCNRPDCEGC